MAWRRQALQLDKAGRPRLAGVHGAQTEGCLLIVFFVIFFVGVVVFAAFSGTNFDNFTFSARAASRTTTFAATARAASAVFSLDCRSTTVLLWTSKAALAVASADEPDEAIMAQKGQRKS